jgi:Alr-MurF fusion protein
MINYRIEDIAQITGGALSGERDRLIRQICTDTRRIDQPSENLFIALKGPSHDGHRFLQEAYAAGIRAFLVEKLPEFISLFAGSTFIIVPDSLASLQKLAAWHRSHFSGKVIAITGSNGKTIIKEWLAQIMQSTFQIARSPKSYNSQLGVSLSVLNISGAEQFAIMEAGVSQPGEMNRLQKILNPDFGLISNIGDAHQENFTSLSAKTKEKIILFKNCPEIFYCKDHDIIHQELSDSGFVGRKHTWSRFKPADLQITNESNLDSGTQLSALYQNRSVNLEIPFTDAASIENIIQIWLLLLTIGFDESILQTQVLQLEPIRMRLEQKAGINGCTLINDYYNSDIQSLKIALDLLFQQTPHNHKTLILSDILQTGLSEENLYREINQLLESRNLYRIIGIGPAIQKNKIVFTKPVSTFSSTSEFLNQLNTDDFKEEAILLKGARSFTFEQISSILEARIHATKLEIRMNDVQFNLQQYRKLVGPKVKIMAMVKAFSYGSGGIEMAKFLANERIDYLGVAFADEGLELRRSGINTPVMVMNPDFHQSEQLIDHHLEPEIYNWSGLITFAKSVRNIGISPYPIHLKMDTGMHRLGFSYKEMENLVYFFKNHPELFIKSVFSHLSSSEDSMQDKFTNLQIKRFSDACGQLYKGMGYPFIKHILNSSGIERFPMAHFDMVRLGIGLYGFGNTGLIDLKPITTLKTIISQIHDLPAGEAVGYGRNAILEKPARIGIIPIGYADGIDRRLGNGNYQMITGGRFINTIGNICMDMTLLDLANTGAEEGDEVIVFGPLNPLTRMSEILKTIPYEVLTSISPRVKRIYQFD